MNNILDNYNKLKPEIKKHLGTFTNKDENQMYKEFMFCLLTPQSNAKKCWEAVEIISQADKLTKSQIAAILKGKSRFHNTKTERIMKAENTWKEIKQLLKEEKDIMELRNKISAKVNGYGLKEAGHFLRNIGKSNNKIAILDRHILRNLEENNAIKNAKIKGNKSYLELEQQALNFAEKTGIPIDELDLLFWHKEHGEFFK